MSYGIDWKHYHWYSIVDVGPPPFDRLCLVRGRHPLYEYWQHAIAYNECYPPYQNMTQKLELYEEDKGKLPVYNGVPFEITEWMLLEQ